MGTLKRIFSRMESASFIKSLPAGIRHKPEKDRLYNRSHFADTNTVEFSWITFARWMMLVTMIPDGLVPVSTVHMTIFISVRQVMLLPSEPLNCSP